jgi:ABC-type sugar transport system substrate-binding protein
MFKMTRTIRLLVITVLLVAAFPVGAAGVNADDASQAYTIGLVLPNLNSPFFEGMVAGAQEAADQNAVDLVVSVADDDIDAELANVEALIEQPVDAIVFRLSGRRGCGCAGGARRRYDAGPGSRPAADPDHG